MTRPREIVFILILVIILGNLSIVLASQNPTGEFQSKNFAVTNMSTVYKKSYFGDRFLIHYDSEMRDSYMINN